MELIKFGRHKIRVFWLLVYCGQSKCVGSTVHWKVWSESPRDKESIHSRSSDDNRQNNQKIINLLRSPKSIQSAPDMIESTVIIFITLIINSHHHSHYHSRYYLLRSPKGIHSAPDMIKSTGSHHRRSCNAERLITWIWDSHIKTFTSWSKFCGFVSKKTDSPHQRLQIWKGRLLPSPPQ